MLCIVTCHTTFNKQMYLSEVPPDHPLALIACVFVHNALVSTGVYPQVCACVCTCV